jgi:hypothetical protein
MNVLKLNVNPHFIRFVLAGLLLIEQPGLAQESGKISKEILPFVERGALAWSLAH